MKNSIAKQLSESKISEIFVSYETKTSAKDRPNITSSLDAALSIRPHFQNIEHRETVFLMLLNRANKAFGVFKISEGGLAGTVCDVSMIFQVALLANAAGIILAHNHPSGNLNPSQTDIKLTKNVKEAGKIIGITLLDHLIITKEFHYSMADNCDF